MGEYVEGPSLPVEAIVHQFSQLAAELQIHLLLGSMTESLRLPDGSTSTEKCYNTSVLFGPGGELLAKYRKIHLFDVAVPNGPNFKESSFIEPGEEVVVCETSLGTIGLSICYDLRFPELYLQLVRRGAQLICVPSAFTAVTGKDHWKPLLQSRAIETQSWVLAPAQWGVHDDKGARQSYGHSLIVDPWGCIVADKGELEGICFAEIDLDRVESVRASIPVQAHRRLI
jgi:predicted amidohydrolase